MLISLVLNCDSRPENYSANEMFKGVVSRDFLTDGLFNKIKFFSGFDLEIIMAIDEHEPVDEETISYIRSLAHVVLIRKHTNEPSFNCWNYWRALAMATGDIVCHMDQDTAAFTSGKEYVEELISHLNTFAFVSYPSHWSPNAVHDPSFGGMTWASTRFFMCKRESLKLGELDNCIREPEWMYEKYGDNPRRCNWTEHFLSKINNNSVFYPPIELEKGTIFSWGSYDKYTLRRLNEYSYDQIKEWLNSHPIQYPNDIYV